MKVAVDRPGKISRSKQSRSNVPPQYASARRFFARLASEIGLNSLQTDFFNNLLNDDFQLKVFGSVMTPVTALAAAIAGLQMKISAFLLPMRPAVFLLLVERHLSPSARTPW